MMFDRCRLLPRAWCVVLFSAMAPGAVAAPTIWGGPTTTFSKPSGADPALPIHQDMLTPSVALTRGLSQGMFNIRAEAAFSTSSPLGTLWATNINNPGDTIAATNWAALEFTTWTAAYGGSIANNILNRNAVVHLVDDDIYLDLRFTTFAGGAANGAFAYQRSTPLPEPAAIVLAAAAAVAAAFRRPAR
jgi:hypothetical protein